jgi:hypothetical protein
MTPKEQKQVKSIAEKYGQILPAGLFRLITNITVGSKSNLAIHH